MTNTSSHVNPSDPLSRYLMSSKWLGFQDGRVRVKYHAFMPHPMLIELSVFMTKGLPEKKIWKIGKRVARRSERTLYGRADVSVSKVLNAGLRIDPDRWPSRHANIVGWPQKKSEQKLIAIKLSTSLNPKLLT